MMRRRLPVAILVLIALGAALAVSLELDRDVRGLFGADSEAETVLDTPEGRALTLAVIHADPDRRGAIARAVAADLSDDPMVSRAATGPETPSLTLVDWFWQVRFLLAPPAPGDLTTEAMTATLSEARAALLDPASAPFAARYLLDPTGSFRRLTGALGQLDAVALPTRDGVAEARDGSAALVFVELAGQPFDAGRQAAFDSALTRRVRAAGAEPLLIGPRSISARISERIAGRSIWIGAIGGAIVLAWLALFLRPAAALLLPFLPLAIGGLAAALVVQAVFGSIHAIALGFGGVLLGLAVDYPLHLIGAAGRRGAARKVMIGAATTAAGFGALTFAGIPAIAQAGCFVAVGLVCAAITAIWLLRDHSGLRLAAISPAPPTVAMPFKLPVLALLALICAAVLSVLPQGSPARLVDVPPQIRAEIARLDTMIGLPSGRHTVEVRDASLAGLVRKLDRVSARLDELKDTGAISRHASLANVLVGDPATALPTASELGPNIAAALGAAGLDPAFAEEILAAYRAAARPDGEGASVPPPPQGPLAHALRTDGSGYLAQVRLWDVSDPAALTALEGPEVRVIDREASLTGRLADLTDRVWLCFAFGAAAALLVLIATVRPWPRVGEIAIATATACIVAALVSALSSGGLGIFQIMALALVAGIGIDYGLFLVLTDDPKEEEQGRRSVFLCASTTFAAFFVMSLSGVLVLAEIGLAVCVGVASMLAANLLRRGRLAASE